MRFFTSALLLLLIFTSCVKFGKGSKYVKYIDYQLVGDGNNNDSTFFEVHYKNRGDDTLKEPLCSMNVKDTVDKTIKNTLFYSSVNGADVMPNSDFYYYFYSEGFNISSEVGKIKFLLIWTNEKNKNSVVRRIVYP
ncbi:MAG: hypothetical protein V4638_01340 [Bacteroidota bacterium]